MMVAAGAAGRGRGGVGMLGTLPATGPGTVGALGRGAPGVIRVGGAFGASLIPAGSGWRGPERIWPGRGEGTGRAGMAVPRVTTPGCGAPGCPVESGGRKGCDERCGGDRSSALSLGASATAGADSVLA